MKLIILNVVFYVLLTMATYVAYPISGKECFTLGITNTPVNQNMFYQNLDTILNYKTFSITIIPVTKTIEFIYNPINPKSIKEIGNSGNWSVLINASYFAGSASKAKHVGVLNIYGKSIAQLAEDKQLTHILSYNKETRVLHFSFYKEYSVISDSSTLEVQTGPLVISNNKLALGYIQSAINGLRKAERTLIAKANDNEIYFIVVREKVNLIELGNYLLTLPIFENKNLEVLNLDGGSSTALYMKDFPQMNFRENKSLPFLIGIK